MSEIDIDIAAAKPKILTDQAVRESDVVITMGCGDVCPFYPGKRYEDWDPTPAPLPRWPEVKTPRRLYFM